MKFLFNGPGRHQEKDKTKNYTPGEEVESNVDLEKLFGKEKFTKISDTKTVETPVATKKSMEPPEVKEEPEEDYKDVTSNFPKAEAAELTVKENNDEFVVCDKEGNPLQDGLTTKSEVNKFITSYLKE